MATMKWCPRCGEYRPLNDFGHDNRMTLKRRSWCKDCERDDWSLRRAGIRPLAPRARDTYRIFVCLCDTAIIDYSNAGACGYCGYPIVSRMHPDNQAVMAGKYPPILSQVVIDPHHETVTA